MNTGGECLKMKSLCCNFLVVCVFVYYTFKVIMNLETVLRQDENQGMLRRLKTS